MQNAKFKMRIQKTKLFKRFLIGFLILFLFFVFFDVGAQTKSASLFLSPSSGNYKVGGTFSITLAVNSPAESINAAEALLKFDPSIIKVTSISKTGSIFEYWPEDPIKNYSNTAGTIKFVGGAPTAYQGSFGRIFTITFQALKEGTASITFESGRVVMAGEVFDTKLTGGTYTITSAEITPSPPALGTPSAPKISSPTHSDPEKWYSNNSPVFTWQVPENITAVRLLIGKRADAVPNVVYEPPISEKKTENLEDGIWYFSAQFKNEVGWGQIGRFKVQIDTTPPQDFEVRMDNEGDSTNPTPIFYFETKDETSGIDFYEIILNNQSFVKVKPDEAKNGWRISPLTPGDYSLIVKAFDKAQNSAQSKNTLTFSIQPIPLEVEKIPSKISEKETLEIKGKTLAETTVKIYIEKEKENPVIREVKSDQNGNFEFREILKRGKYFIYLQAQDKRGALSKMTDKHSLEVVAERLTLYLTIILIILIIIGILIIFWLWWRIKKEKEKSKKEEVKKKEDPKEIALKILKEKVQEQIKYLEEKVDLSRSETRLLNALKEALKSAEEQSKQEKIE